MARFAARWTAPSSIAPNSASTATRISTRGADMDPIRARVLVAIQAVSDCPGTVAEEDAAERLVTGKSFAALAASKTAPAGAPPWT